LSDSALSAAYSQAQALVDNFSLSGMPAMSPQWAPPVRGGRPSHPAPPPPASWAEPMAHAVSQLEHRVAGMTAHREVLRALLIRVREQDQYADDLIDLARESQAAQVGALIACASLIVALPDHLAGDLPGRQALNAQLNGITLRLKNGLARLSRSISKIPRSSGDLDAALAALQAAIEECSAKLSRVHVLEDLMQWLRETGDHILEAVKLIEALDEVQDKHQLLFAARVFEDYVVDVLKDAAVSAGSRQLLEAGRAGAAHALTLASFAVDYAYNAGRFYVAWTGVQQALAGLDDSSRLAATLSTQITQTTDQIKSSRAELERLKSAQATGVNAQQVLHEFNAREQQNAYRQGEWFTRNTGFQAPGGPIFQGSDQ
jgi:hypothetical protein